MYFSCWRARAGNDDFQGHQIAAEESLITRPAIGKYVESVVRFSSWPNHNSWTLPLDLWRRHVVCRYQARSERIKCDREIVHAIIAEAERSVRRQDCTRVAAAEVHRSGVIGHCAVEQILGGERDRNRSALRR